MSVSIECGECNGSFASDTKLELMIVFLQHEKERHPDCWDAGRQTALGVAKTFHDANLSDATQTPAVGRAA